MRNLTFEKYTGGVHCIFCGHMNTRTALRYANSRLGVSKVFPICMECLRDINDHIYKRAAERIRSYALNLETKAEQKTAEKIANIFVAEGEE